MLGIGIGIAALGVAIGLGLIGFSALQGMSRQPEAIGKLQVVMLIAFAFVELVFLLSAFVVPSIVGGQEVKIAQAAAGAAPSSGETK